MSTIAQIARQMAVGNDGKAKDGEAKKFHDNMKDMKDDGKVNKSTLMDKIRSKKDGDK